MRQGNVIMSAQWRKEIETIQQLWSRLAMVFAQRKKSKRIQAGGLHEQFI
jgi:hypothetical protein